MILQLQIIYLTNRTMQKLHSHRKFDILVSLLLAEESNEFSSGSAKHLPWIITAMQ